MRKKLENHEELPEINTSRRKALAKLGLSMLAVYAAPTVLNLNKAAAYSSGDSVDSIDSSADSSNSSESSESSESSVSSEDSVSGESSVDGSNDSSSV